MHQFMLGRCRCNNADALCNHQLLLLILRDVNIAVLASDVASLIQGMITMISHTVMDQKLCLYEYIEICCNAKSLAVLRSLRSG